MKTIEEIWSIVNGLKELYRMGLLSGLTERTMSCCSRCVVAAQCTDERVNKVTPALYARFPTLEALAEADIAEVERYIHSTGFSGPRRRTSCWPPRCFCGTTEGGCRTPWRSC